MADRKKRISRLIIALAVLFFLVSGSGLYCASRFINEKLMNSGKAMATDIALLVKNNFSISDEEVAYMKTLTFNEMEVDPINQRLMDVGNGVVLNAEVTNVYIISPLNEDEYRYCPDEETAQFLGFDKTAPLDGIWLLNGKIDEKGQFAVAQREDIFRYTVLDSHQRRGMAKREAFGELSSDAWGSFITGYAPIYTTEGSFVGLLGIDMDPDPYQTSALHVIMLIIVLFAVTVLMMSGWFIVFHIRYSRAREMQRRYEFYSDMSHEMRTPMNGILGTTALSKAETDINVLQRNIELIESSGRHLLELINRTLDYKNSISTDISDKSNPTDDILPEHGFPALSGKRILICEDNPINAEITRRMAENVGCEVDTAENGSMGLELFSASENDYYDAVLMDIRMPVMDGLEATEKIRALKRADAKTVPIIALTANSYEEDKDATSAAGMSAHLTKPVEPQQLYHALYAAISDREQAGFYRRKRR